MEEKTEEIAIKRSDNEQRGPNAPNQSPQNAVTPGGDPQLQHQQHQQQQQQVQQQVSGNGSQPKMQFDFGALTNMMKINFGGQNPQHQTQRTPTNVPQTAPNAVNAGNAQQS